MCHFRTCLRNLPATSAAAATSFFSELEMVMLRFTLSIDRMPGSALAITPPIEVELNRFGLITASACFRTASMAASTSKKADAADARSRFEVTRIRGGLSAMLSPNSFTTSPAAACIAL